MSGSNRPGRPEIVTMLPDCTLRAIDAAHRTLRQVSPSATAVRVDCGEVEQADTAFAQLIVSAQVTFAAHGTSLTLDPAPACVRAVFVRSGIPMPGAGQTSP